MRIIRTGPQDQDLQGPPGPTFRPGPSKASRAAPPGQGMKEKGLQDMRDSAKTLHSRGPGPHTLSQILNCAHCQTRFKVIPSYVFVFLDITMNQIKYLLKFAKN